MMPPRLNLGPEAPELAGKVVPMTPFDSADAAERKRLDSENIRLVALWRKAQAGDNSAAGDLLLELVPMLRSLASRLANWGRVEVEDLVQEALLEVWLNLRRFDPKRKTSLKTFTYTVGKRAMWAAVLRLAGISKHYFRIWSKVLDTTTELIQEIGRKPTNAETAARAGLSEEVVDKALDHLAIAWPVSLDEMQDERPDRDSASDHVSVSRALIVEPVEADQDRFRLLDEALQRLEERERSIVMLFYYESRSHKEIAKALSFVKSDAKKEFETAVSKSKAILKRALPKLRLMLENIL